MEDSPDTCVVFLLGYPGVGKRTVGSHLAELLDGVLVDNALLSIPLLTLFKWDGKSPITMAIWERVGLIREVVLGTIEDLAPRSNSYVFTNVLKDDEDGLGQYERVRDLARRRGSLFLSEDGIRKVLMRLREQGIVLSERGGNAYPYKFNHEHVAAGPIKQLANAHAVLLERIEALLKLWQVPPVYAAVFGSMARGTGSVHSDVDLLLIRPDRAPDDLWTNQVDDLDAM